MATTTVKNLGSTTLAAALGTIYTPPTATSAVIRGASFCNTTAAVVLLTVQLSPRTAAASRILVSARPLAANETYLASELLNKVIEPGGALGGSGLGIQADIAGVEIV